MSIAFLFPGQGSQAVGMGRALYDAFASAREVFEEVDDALGEKLSQLMFDGPDSDLVLTANAQPALMAVSLATVRVLEKEAGFRLAERATYVAGHSLGEYSALAAAGALGLADTARLLRLRGSAMQAAVPVGQGSMAALLGAELADAEAIARDAAEGDVCTVANDNAPGQVVISGHRAAIERAVALAAERGFKRSVILPVSAPFHCPLMQPAADAMAAALAEAKLLVPAVPVVANVTAAPESDPAALRELLVRQVCGTVRWRESVQRMAADGVTRGIELGTGKVLAGLVKRIDRSIECTSIGAPADIDALLASV